VQKILTNVTITPIITKGRSVQETKQVLSYILVASLAIQQQLLSPTTTTTLRTTTTTKTTSKINNYDYYDYYEESNPIILQVNFQI
jgi:hypothetical protein